MWTHVVDFKSLCFSMNSDWKTKSSSLRSEEVDSKEVALCCHLLVIHLYHINNHIYDVWALIHTRSFLFPGSQTSVNDSCESPSSSSSSSCPPLLTPTGSGPDDVGMFDVDPSDMGTSSQQNFDPRRHSFSEEELKPQPMIKKARKVLVPDNLKVRVRVRPLGL